MDARKPQPNETRSARLPCVTLSHISRSMRVAFYDGAVGDILSKSGEKAATKNTQDQRTTIALISASSSPPEQAHVSLGHHLGIRMHLINEAQVQLSSPTHFSTSPRN